MENSTVAGLHMTRDIFTKALELTARLEGLAWSQGIPPLILLSGGECTEHPDIVTYIEEVIRRKFFPVLITNGMWLDNPELRAAILRPEWKHLFIQVTNDSRFYPSKPKEIPIDPRIVFVPSLTKLLPLGRFKPKQATADLPIKDAPSSFNIRSLTRHFGDIRKALVVLRSRAVAGQSGHCTPSISSDGTIVAGESNACFAIGTVDSSAEDITKAITSMVCNRCGLVGNLTQEQRVAIGESRIYAP